MPLFANVLMLRTFLIKTFFLLNFFGFFVFPSFLIAQDWNEVLNATATGPAITSGSVFGISSAMDGDYAVIGAYGEATDAAGKNYMLQAGAAYILKKNAMGEWIELKKIVASDRMGNALFGGSVAIHNDYIIIGASNEAKDAEGNNSLTRSGAVYIFKKDEGGTDNWGQIKKIVASDRAFGALFGGAISIYGDYIAVGARLNSRDAMGGNSLSGAGAAYLFKKDEGGTDNWGQIKKIVASDRASKDNFGAALAIYQDYLVIGAPLKGLGTLASSGEVYILKKDEGGTDNWGELKKINAPMRAKDDNFGARIALHGDQVLISAYKRKIFGVLTEGGEAYLFEKEEGGMDNWGVKKTFRASDAAANDNYGYSVAFNGAYAIIGAYNEDPLVGGNNLENAGAAYIYKKDEGGTDQWGAIKKITTADATADDNFGSSAAISGQDILISAFAENEDVNGNFYSGHAGSAYVFKTNHGGAENWGQTQKVIASDRGSGQNKFGTAIAIDGNYAVIGAVDESSSNAAGGVAYIYQKNNMGVWEEIKKITSSDNVANEGFGDNVAISGDYVVVGVRQKNYMEGGNTLQSVGAAYVFKKDHGGSNNWGEVKKLLAPMKKTGDLFGVKVAIDGEYILVGASGEDEDTNEANALENAGAAYLFKKDEGGIDNWGMIKKITASDREENAQFGTGLDIDGAYIFVGATQKDESDGGGNTLQNAGAVYVFKKDQGGAKNWGEIKKITDADKASNAAWGKNISISGDYAIIGTPNKSPSGASQAGAAYIFKKDQGGMDNWGQLKVITASDKVASDQFGSSVAISGDYAFVGSPFHDTHSLFNNGAAYVFKMDEGGMDNWGEVQKILASENEFQSNFGTALSATQGMAIISTPNLKRGHSFFYQMTMKLSITNPTNDTTCVNGNALFTAVGTAGNGGNLSYQWQKRPKNGTFQDMANETNDSLQLSNLLIGENESEYRIIVTETNGMESQKDTSAAATLIILGNPSLTNLANDTTCVNENATFTVMGTANANGILSYQWQKKTSDFDVIGNLTFTDLMNETNATLNLSNVMNEDNESLYRLVLSERVHTVVCTDTSNIAKLIVSNPRILGSEAVCAGNNSVTLELVGHIGTIEKWQSSTDENFSNPTDISNTSATHTVTNATATTFFRAIIQNAHCQNSFAKSACIIMDVVDVNNNNIPDCQENCMPSIQVTGAIAAPIKSGTYRAINTIASNGQTEPNAVVNFKAGQSITLTAGFHVTGAKSFLATIESCVNPLVEKEEEDIYNKLRPEIKPSSIRLNVQPNPFKESTQIQFVLPQEEVLSIQLFNQTGSFIKEILPQQLRTAGIHSIPFNKNDLFGGMYYFVLQTSKERLIQKVIRLK